MAIAVEETALKAGHSSAAEEAKRRMLEWPESPVEFVNNLYGCHAADPVGYFEWVFGGLG